MQVIQDSIQNEMAQVMGLITKSTTSSIGLINDIAKYALTQPGRKMMRPKMLILFAKSLNFWDPDVLKIATIIELIHAATLLHDDVIDNAEIRRNHKAPHKVFGGNQSILMGDFVYSAAFSLIAELDNSAITHLLAKATREIVEGEILQMSLQHQVDTSLADYFRVIQAKTALLFSTGAACIERIHPKNPYPKAIETYAHHFGMLYQITDDILDIDTQNTALNKQHGTDIKEGKMTLPTLLAYQQANDNDQYAIKQIIAGKQPWEDILPIIERTQALRHCSPYIKHHQQQGLQALTMLPKSPYTQHLINLINQVPKRKQ